MYILSNALVALRALSRAKAFTTLVTLNLCLGIGVVVAMFSVAEEILFSAPRYPAQLYLLRSKSSRGEILPCVWQPAARAYLGITRVYSDKCLASDVIENISIGDIPVATNVKAVSWNFFSVLNISPAIGRCFLPDEDKIGNNNVVVISERFRKAHFAYGEEVLGKNIRVGRINCEVVGVLRPNQRLPYYGNGDLYRPLVLEENPSRPYGALLYVFIKLRSDVSREMAEAAFSKATIDLPRQLLRPFEGSVPLLQPIDELNKLNRPEIYWVLLASVGLLYAIAAINAGNLVITRLARKRHELGIRMAVGCSRLRALSPSIWEAVIVSFVGGLCGAALGRVLLPVFGRLATGVWKSRGGIDWFVDVKILAALGAITILSGASLAFALGMFGCRVGIREIISEGGIGVAGSRRRSALRQFQVLIQVALAVVLLVGSGLMVKTFRQFQRVDLGFEADRRVKVRLIFPQGTATEGPERLRSLRFISDSIRHIPGVKAVAFGSDNIMAGFEPSSPYEILSGDGRPMTVNIGYVSDGYGDVAGMKLSAGRWPTPTSKNEIAVNKSFAVDYFALENPIGQAIRLRSRPGNTADVWVVVGVVKDVRQNIRVTPGYHLYAPESWRAQEMTTFIVEMAVDNSQNLTDVVRRAIYKVNPDIVTIQVSSLTQLRDQQLYYERYSSSVLNVLSAIALLLTTTGTFSVVAYTVEQRMQEFGIRLALGATPNALQKLVFSDGMTIVLVGIVLGMSFAAVLARFLESLLFETPRNDPFVLAAVALTISLVSAGACTIPAYRATRANAADLLRVG